MVLRNACFRYKVPRMATIKDVAARAGVSTATVSRILADPNVCLPATRMKVLAAVDELDYAPNFAAKSLRTTRSSKIVVTVPDVSNPFFSLVLRGIQNVAQPAGYAVLVGDTHLDPVREEAYGDMLLRKEADGLIFLGHKLPPSLNRLVQSKEGRAPIVNGGEFDSPVEISSAHIDNAQAASDMFDHLAGLGHRQIAVIAGPLTSPASRERVSGVRRAVIKHDLQDTVSIHHTQFSIEAGEAAARSILAEPDHPTALLCLSDEQAFGVLATLRELGLKCPDNISVTGFDDTRYARVSLPALTSIHQPMIELGEEMVRLLLGIIKGTITNPRSVTLKHAIVVRHSTAPAKGER
ncbi:MAG: LacI family DNA-binding transcriptional regulator [Novosphingobium sp.]